MISALAVLLLLAALLLVLIARWQRRGGGLSSGELIYSDVAAEAAPVLLSHRFGLKGKPDALVRTAAGDIIPVERKKTRAPRSRPYESDLIQATAYCILVEENYGKTPPYMRIEYLDRYFDEPYTPSFRQSVLTICEQVRQARRAETCNRSHAIAAKCRSCGHNQNCGQALR